MAKRTIVIGKCELCKKKKVQGITFNAYLVCYKCYSKLCSIQFQI